MTADVKTLITASTNFEKEKYITVTSTWTTEECATLLKSLTEN